MRDLGGGGAASDGVLPRRLLRLRLSSCAGLVSGGGVGRYDSPTLYRQRAASVSGWCVSAFPAWSPSSEPYVLLDCWAARRSTAVALLLQRPTVLVTKPNTNDRAGTWRYDCRAEMQRATEQKGRSGVDVRVNAINNVVLLIGV